jgi:hypothetical protein
VFDEQICAGEEHVDFFKMKRQVNLIDTSSSDAAARKSAGDKSCLWKLGSIDKGETNKFVIWNVKYGEPLYAPSVLFKTSKTRRNVFTYAAEPHSSSFVWQIDCNA